MNFLVDFYAQFPYLVYFQGAFTVWMLLDASRRHVEHHWYYIILFVPFFGPWAYFITILLPELGTGKITFFQRKVSLDELRFRAEQSPTLANQLELGERLLELGDFVAARTALEGAHRLEVGHGQVQYSLAFCHMQLGEPARAVPLLENINKRDPRWSNYRAWLLLVDVQLTLNDPTAALAAARELVNLSPLLQHRCVLADLLVQQSQFIEARMMLQQGLQEHDFAPGHSRRRNRSWAREARRLLSLTER